MITEITQFKTSDGQLFNNLQDAKGHEEWMDMIEFIRVRTSVSEEDIREVISILKHQYVIKDKNDESNS